MTHYVVWTQVDKTGLRAAYASQHMLRAQAYAVASIKQIEGAKDVRIKRV